MKIVAAEIMKVREELFINRVGSSMCALTHQIGRIVNLAISNKIEVVHTELEVTLIQSSGQYWAHSHVLISHLDFVDFEFMIRALGPEPPYLYYVAHGDDLWFNGVELDVQLADVLERIMHEISSRFKPRPGHRGRFSKVLDH